MSDLNQNYFEKITYRDALRLAMHDAMKEDKKIIIMGEDVANYGGAYGATKDLLKLFGKERVIAGTDCGFGTFAGFGNVDPDIAYLKLQSLVEGASKVKWVIMDI